MPNLRKTVTGQILSSRAFYAIFVSIAAFLFLISTVSNISAGGNVQHNAYLSLATLNNEMKTSNYLYPGIVSNDTNTKVGSVASIDNFVAVDDGQSKNDTSIMWHLSVHNGMPEAEYVKIKVKLLNSTQLIPDDLTNQPSPEPEIFQFSTVMPSNSDQSIPFEWRIKSVSKSEDGYLTINQIMINDKLIDNVKAISADGQHFRFVFELWRYDNDISQFQYSWSSPADNPGIKRSVWNQIWFSVMN